MTTMQIRTGPETYELGLGEVIRGYRMYIGLSQPAMAHRIGMATRSYERIEEGERHCPPGFIDTLRELMNDFDDAVDVAIRSERVLERPEVRLGEDEEYRRAVMGRAAIATPRITPALVR